MLAEYDLKPASGQQPFRSEPFQTWRSPDQDIWLEFHRVPLGYLLRFPGLADFEVAADGSRVACVPVAGLDEETRDHLFRNAVRPLSWNRQGQHVFHASCVKIGEGAVLFLGASGMGKSTLAVKLATRGFPILSDDVVRIERSEDVFRALPTEPSFRLWSDSTQHLLEEGARMAPRNTISDKNRIVGSFRVPRCEDPIPVIGAFFLERGGVAEVSQQRIKAAKTQFSWIRNSFILDIADKGSLMDNFDITRRLSSDIWCAILDYPRRFECLDEVADTIVEAVTRKV